MRGARGHNSQTFFQRCGGVSMDGMSGSGVRLNWEISGHELETKRASTLGTSGLAPQG